MATRQVTVTLTNSVVGSYEARSYPDDDYDNNGKIELYKVPVHKIIVSGTDSTGNAKTIDYKAPRFMPYWNDPKKPDKHYKSRGWINAGLSSARRITVTRYKRDYAISNRPSTERGAIVMKGAFYIHPGPPNDSAVGFGSAGCVEIIGSFTQFKADIASLSGSSKTDSDDAIDDLVKTRKLIVVIQQAKVPNIKKAFTKEVTP